MWPACPVCSCVLSLCTWFFFFQGQNVLEWMRVLSSVHIAPRQSYCTCRCFNHCNAIRKVSSVGLAFTLPSSVCVTSAPLFVGIAFLFFLCFHKRPSQIYWRRYFTGATKRIHVRSRFSLYVEPVQLQMGFLLFFFPLVKLMKIDKYCVWCTVTAIRHAITCFARNPQPFPWLLMDQWQQPPQPQ